ncbi:putative pirin domain protein [Xylogone sp. PMI_703]|nr:putative pirin domain protein [Xylogone sp. PMI_703]
MIQIMGIFQSNEWQVSKAKLQSSLILFSSFFGLILFSNPMVLAALKRFAMSSNSSLSEAQISFVPSAKRNFVDYGWVNSYQTINPNGKNPVPGGTGSLAILNEDRVKPLTGFPMHFHRDYEIFSYVISGELTHRDSMSTKKATQDLTSKDFYIMKRGNVQFTAAGSGISHSEKNERDDVWVHFLQIWVSPWKFGLTPKYHTAEFNEADKRKKFIPIVSPLKAGPEASAEEEETAEPSIPGTIPIHADFVMGAAIIPANKTFSWIVGYDGVVEKKNDRVIYIHFPTTKEGKSKLRIEGSDVVLSEGDGVALTKINANTRIDVTSIGDTEAEIVLFDAESD